MSPLPSAPSVLPVPVHWLLKVPFKELRIPTMGVDKCVLSKHLGFAAYVVSLIATQFCLCSMKAERQYINKSVLLCFVQNLFTKAGSRPIISAQL